ncbi:MauE/DoxX family redox-associated membrane protein [Curtobacterium sp. S6]|uniref:MauE/DoxX family redox-associated membrane protein n=1 Tax=Curtobacterium sp. S6 TaxID=1479623 RepID=UPI0004AAFC74|nr:MauE/DoxX family redox-associated membrane protein [Curtobacterium sp. S6]
MTANLVPAVVLAVVLIWSGVAKLRAPGSVVSAMENLGVPAAVRRRVVVRAFPWGEILLGVLLVAAPGALAPAVALVCLALFATYWALIYRVLGFDEPVACHCFGASSASEVTHRTLWRNTMFVLLALWWTAASVAASGPARWRDVTGADALWGLGLLCVAATVWLVTVPPAGAPKPRREEDPGNSATSARSGAGTTVAPAQEPVGDELDYLRTPIPGVVVQTADGELVSLRSLASSQARLLLWVSAGCGSCAAVMREAAGWRTEFSPTVGVHLVTPSSREALETVAHRSLWDSALYDVGGVVSEVMELPGTPAAILLGADGLLAGGPVLGHEVIGFVRDVRVELAAARPGQGLPQERS